MNQRANDALIALRRIQRKIELEARLLARDANLTPSQLRVLQLLDEHESISAGEIAAKTQLSNATITALIDRMVVRNLVARTRCNTDRRKVWLALLPDGRKALKDAPRNLQLIFQSRFDALEPWEQAMLISSLEKVALMLDADSLEVAPILTAGEIDQKTKSDEGV